MSNYEKFLIQLKEWKSIYEGQKAEVYEPSEFAQSRSDNLNIIKSLLSKVELALAELSKNDTNRELIDQVGVRFEEIALITASIFEMNVVLDFVSKAKKELPGYLKIIKSELKIENGTSWQNELIQQRERNIESLQIMYAELQASLNNINTSQEITEAQQLQSQAKIQINKLNALIKEISLNDKTVEEIDSVRTLEIRKEQELAKLEEDNNRLLSKINANLKDIEALEATNWKELNLPPFGVNKSKIDQSTAVVSKNNVQGVENKEALNFKQNVDLALASFDAKRIKFIEDRKQLRTTENNSDKKSLLLRENNLLKDQLASSESTVLKILEFINKISSIDAKLSAITQFNTAFAEISKKVADLKQTMSAELYDQNGQKIDDLKTELDQFYKQANNIKNKINAEAYLNQSDYVEFSKNISELRSIEQKVDQTILLINEEIPQQKARNIIRQGLIRDYLMSRERLSWLLECLNKDTFKTMQPIKELLLAENKKEFRFKEIMVNEPLESINRKMDDINSVILKMQSLLDTQKICGALDTHQQLIDEHQLLASFAKNTFNKEMPLPQVIIDYQDTQQCNFGNLLLKTGTKDSLTKQWENYFTVLCDHRKNEVENAVQDIKSAINVLKEDIEKRYPLFNEKDAPEELREKIKEYNQKRGLIIFSKVGDYTEQLQNLKRAREQIAKESLTNYITKLEADIQQLRDSSAEENNIKKLEDLKNRLALLNNFRTATTTDIDAHFNKREEQITKEQNNAVNKLTATKREALTNLDPKKEAQRQDLIRMYVNEERRLTAPYTQDKIALGKQKKQLEIDLKNQYFYEFPNELIKLEKKEKNVTDLSNKLDQVINALKQLALDINKIKLTATKNQIPLLDKALEAIQTQINEANGNLAILHNTSLFLSLESDVALGSSANFLNQLPSQINSLTDEKVSQSLDKAGQSGWDEFITLIKEAFERVCKIVNYNPGFDYTPKESPTRKVYQENVNQVQTFFKGNTAATPQQGDDDYTFKELPSLL